MEDGCVLQHDQGAASCELPPARLLGHDRSGVGQEELRQVPAGRPGEEKSEKIGLCSVLYYLRDVGTGHDRSGRLCGPWPHSVPASASHWRPQRVPLLHRRLLLLPRLGAEGTHRPLPRPRVQGGVRRGLPRQEQVHQAQPVPVRRRKDHAQVPAAAAAGRKRDVCFGRWFVLIVNKMSCTRAANDAFQCFSLSVSQLAPCPPSLRPVVQPA